MTTSPHVELLAPGVDLKTLAVEGGRAGTLEEQIQAGIMSYRLLVINYAKMRLGDAGDISGATVLKLLNEASALYLGRFNGIVGPAAAAAYLKAYQAADAGDVPVETIYALADAHTKRLAHYYDETSREALLGGFNTYVNRQVPAKVAAQRALDAYGLTPRQMSGYTSLSVKGVINSARPISLKRRALEYIGNSIRRRVKVFSEQEAHNLELQAKQTAWLWLQDKGVLSPNAQKMWLTANDEKTCAICGPMHGKKIDVGDRFELPNGIEVWVPGPHPNCRCEVRVLDLGGEVSKADWNPKLHPRGGNPENRGEFSRQTMHTKIDDLGNEIEAFPGRDPRVQVAGQVAPELDADTQAKRAALEQTYEDIQRLIGRLEERQEAAARARKASLRPIARSTPVEEKREERKPLRPIPRTDKPQALKPLARQGAEPRKQGSLRSLRPALSQENQLELLSGSGKSLKPIPREGQEAQRSFKGLEFLEPQAQAKWRTRDMVVPLDAQYRPMYAVVDDFDPDDHMYEFADETFDYGYTKAVQRAAMFRDSKIRQAVMRNTNQYQSLAKFDWVDHSAPTGAATYEARLSADQLRDIVKKIARSSTIEGAADRSVHDAIIEVPLYLKSDLGGGHVVAGDHITNYGHSHPIGTHPMSAIEIGEHLNIYPQDFRVRVLKLTNVHDPKGGQGYHGALSAYEGDMSVTGAYEESHTDTDYERSGDVGVDVITVVPMDPAVEQVRDYEA